MRPRLVPALASATAITFLVLLALPMLAVRDPGRTDEPRLNAVKLFFADAPRWKRMPEARQLRPEEFNLEQLDVSPRMSSQPVEGFLTPDLSVGAGPGLALDLGLETSDLHGGPDLAGITFEVGQVDEPPRAVRQVQPQYPANALRKGLTGKVELRFLVETDGSVSQVQVVSSEPGDVFERSAVRAVEQWRFSPGIYQGQPVRTWVRIPIAFELE